MKGSVEVCLSPSLLDQYSLSGKTLVIVDIFRAGSCMATALAHGVEKIKPVARIGEARVLGRQGYIMAGERGGARVEGFDLGNSPFDFITDKFQAKRVVMTTTNGTICLKMSEGAGRQVIGSFLNLSATVGYLTGCEGDILILCAGWNGSINLEDTLYAGNLVDVLSSSFSTSSDAAQLAGVLYRQAKDDMKDFLKNATHVKRLVKLNYERDIEYCLQKDVFDFPVVVKDDFIVKI